MARSDTTGILELQVLLGDPRATMREDPARFLELAVEVLTDPGKRAAFLDLLPEDDPPGDMARIVSALKASGLWSLDEETLAGILASRSLLRAVHGALGDADGLTELPAPSLGARLVDAVSAVTSALGDLSGLQPAPAYADLRQDGSPARAELRLPHHILLTAKAPVFWLVVILHPDGEVGVPAPFSADGCVRCRCWGGPVGPDEVDLGSSAMGCQVLVVASATDFLGEGTSMDALPVRFAQHTAYLAAQWMILPQPGMPRPRP